MEAGTGINFTPMNNPINDTKTVLVTEISNIKKTGIKIITKTIKLNAQKIVAIPKVVSMALFATGINKLIIWTQTKGKPLTPKAFTLLTEKSTKLLHDLQSNFVHAVCPLVTMRNLITSTTARFCWTTLVSGEENPW